MQHDTDTPHDWWSSRPDQLARENDRRYPIDLARKRRNRMWINSALVGGLAIAFACTLKLLAGI